MVGVGLSRKSDNGPARLVSLIYVHSFPCSHEPAVTRNKWQLDDCRSDATPKEVRPYDQMKMPISGRSA